MAQLDKFLQAMTSNKASALVLTDGEAAKLEIGGQLRPLTKVALTGAQILALLQEVANPNEQMTLSVGNPVEILRATPDGAFVIKGQMASGVWRAVASMAKAPPESTPAAPAPNAEPRKRPSVAMKPVIEPPPAPVSAAPGEVVDLDSIPWFEGIEAARQKIDALLTVLIQRGGSDLHLRVGEPAILRHGGEMVRIEGEEVLTDRLLFDMIRSIMPERNRIEYANTNDSDFAHEIKGLARFRANAAKDRNGAVAVFRQIPATVVSVEQMKVTEEVQRLCFLTKGLVLVTGPTGSGKSTTLCALIDLVNRERTDHVITIEDPIEFVHPNKKCIITQRQVGVHTKSFKSALRAALREDPDIILVGEMRDLETISIALETAETGHLVFGTLHTTTAAGTVDRIIDQFPADRQEQVRTMMAESLKGVVSQTLCKKIGGGRVAAREILLSTPSITNLIRESKTFQIQSVIQTSKKMGMVTLNDALIAYVDSGEVEPKEAYMKSVDKAGLVMMLKNRNLDVSFAESDHDKDKAAAGPPGGAATPGAGAKPAMAGKK